MEISPPSAPRRPVTTVRHGEAFIDDFAWLRDREDPEVTAYLEAENAYAEAQLTSQKGLQELLYTEMLARIKETDLSVPVRRGNYWYYTRTEEGLQYPIHCRRQGSMTEGTEQVLVDLNHLAEGKSFMALGAFAVSDDARYLAYSTDETGYRQYTLQVKDLETGVHLPLRRERATSVAWAAGDLELLWVEEDPDTKRGCRLWRSSREGGEDALIFEEHDEAHSLSVGRTRSREWLVMQSGSHTTSETHVIPAEDPGAIPRVLLPRRREIEYDIDHHDDWFYIRINDTGRNFRLVRVPVNDLRGDTLDEIVPHREAVMLEGHDCFANHLILAEREAGITQLVVRPFGADAPYRITFPEPVFEASLHANPEWLLNEVRIAYQSLVTPPSVYEYHLDSRERTLLKQQEIVGGYDATRFVSERVFATAADGTRIPISLVRRADTPVDGTAACFLQGYGSYGYPYPVAFSSTRLSLLERGLVVALAHIRGGGELGKPWHDAGRMAHKTNTFTDFIACAEHLKSAGYLARGRLVIEGGSAGGLLMGAVTNLRPDLFAGVVSQVPFVDVLNTMSDPTLPLTVAEYEEWGNPGIAEEFAWMRAYCPYTNLRAVAYPAMLVRTSFNDSQVMYWEPAKYVARLRLMTSSTAPILFLTNMGAGHGGASGRYDRLREIAVDYAWILAMLDAPQFPI